MVIIGDSCYPAKMRWMSVLTWILGGAILSLRPAQAIEGPTPPQDLENERRLEALVGEAMALDRERNPSAGGKFEAAAAEAEKRQAFRKALVYFSLAGQRLVEAGDCGGGERVLERMNRVPLFDDKLTLQLLDPLIKCLLVKHVEHQKLLFLVSRAANLHERRGDRENWLRMTRLVVDEFRHLGDNDLGALVEFRKYDAALEARGDIELASEYFDLGIRALNARRTYHAWALFKRCVVAAKREGVLHNSGVCKSALGLAETLLGNYSAGLTLNLEGLDLIRKGSTQLALKNPSGRLASEGFVLKNLGAVYSRLGYYEAAIAIQRITVALFESAGVKDAGLYNDLATSLMENGEGFEAFNIFKKADEALPGKNVALTGIGELYMKMGSPHMACQLWQALFDPLRMARCNLGMGNFEQAKQGIQGVERYGIAYGEGPMILGAQIALGLANEGLKDYASAAANFEEAVDGMEMMRAKLPNTERLNLLAAKEYGFPRLAAYKGLVRVAPHTPLGQRGSFFFSESAHARNFLELEARKGTTAAAAAFPELSKAAAQIESRLDAARHRYLESQVGRVDFRETNTAMEEMGKIWAERKAFIAEARRTDPEFVATRYPEALPIESVELDADEVLIEFDISDQLTKAFVVKSGTIAFAAELPITWSKLDEVVRLYRASFENIHDFSDLARLDVGAGKFLFDTLLAPLLSAKDANGTALVPEQSRIIVIPDGILAILPFESLPMDAPLKVEMPDGRFGPIPLGVKYVADAYDIAYQSSASTLVQQRRYNRKRPQMADRALIVADPIFGAADPRAKRFFAKRSETIERLEKDFSGAIQKMGIGGIRASSSSVKEISPRTDVWPRLAQTGAMAERLQGEAFTGGRATTLLGKDATESALRKLPLERFRYLVFATHGILNGHIPVIHEPALVLSQYDNDSGFDGFLTMSEVMELKLNAEVAALTACQTGLGKSISGEGVMSLGRAFQYAGARNVLMSLWETSDRASPDLIERFMKHLRNGRTPRQALRQARTDIRADGYSHPYYWAPFVLVTE